MCYKDRCVIVYVRVCACACMYVRVTGMDNKKVRQESRSSHRVTKSLVYSLYTF